MNKEYLMTIELEKGKEQILIINNNTNPEELAFNFSKLYNLNFKAMNYLINEIKKVKQNFYEEKTNSNTIKLTSLNSSFNDNETNNLIENNKNLQKNKKNKKNYLIKSKSDIKILKKRLKNNNNSNKNLFFENLFYNNNNNIISYNKFYNNLQNKILNNNNNKRLNISYSINNITNKNYKINNNKNVNKKTRNFQTSLKYKNNSFNKSFHKNLLKKDNNLNNKEINLSKNIISQTDNKLNNNNDKLNKKNHIIKKENINYGKLLYEKNLKLKELEKIKKEALKNSIINPEPKNKFIPKINSKSKKIAKKLNNNKIYDFNAFNYKIYLENKSKKLNEKYQPEKYSYTPKLNKNSLKIENLKNSKKKINRIEKLYKSKSSENFHKHLKNIESNMYDQFKFKPNLIKNKSCKKFHNQNLSFDERQKIYYKNSKDKKLKIINENNYSFDKITGQKLFHPIINSKKNNEIFSNKYNQNSNIYDILYSYAEIYKNKKKNKIENRSNYVITDVNSYKILEKKKLKIFSYIFDKLDSCNEGSINILNMDLKKLPISIINILNPIFKEIKESNEKINKIDFIEGCFKLFDDLDYNQKNTILNYGNEISNKINKKIKNNFSFHPNININSIKINNEIISNGFHRNKINKSEEEFDSSYKNFLISNNNNNNNN